MSLRRLSFTISLVVAFTACSGADARCAAIVDGAIDVYQELITTVDGLDLGDAAAGTDDFVIPGIDDIEARADILQAEAEEAGCDDGELRELLTERIVRLKARTVFGQAVVEGIRREGLFGEE